MVEGRAVLFSLQGSRSDINTERCGDRTSNFTKTSPLHCPSYHFAYHNADSWPDRGITRSGLVIHAVGQVLREVMYIPLNILKILQIGRAFHAVVF